MEGTYPPMHSGSVAFCVTVMVVTVTQVFGLMPGSRVCWTNECWELHIAPAEVMSIVRPLPETPVTRHGTADPFEGAAAPAVASDETTGPAAVDSGSGLA